MKLSRGASDWQQLVSLCCVIDLQQRENAASRNRLRSEAAVHDVIYGHLDWKWGSETPTDPPPPANCTYMYMMTHMNIHTDAFSVIAVLQWSVEEVVIASLQPLTSWSRLSVRRTLPSQSIYRQISRQMMQIWNNGLILDADRRRSPQNADDDVDWRDAPELNTIFCTNCLFSAHLFSVITSARREVHSLFVA